MVVDHLEFDQLGNLWIIPVIELELINNVFVRPDQPMIVMRSLCGNVDLISDVTPREHRYLVGS